MSQAVSSNIDQSVVSVKKERLASLDVLRGFDMFWIIGGAPLAMSVIDFLGIGWLMPFKSQFDHVEWNGFSMHDLIFPLFIFIAGISMQFSVMSKIRSGASFGGTFLRVVRRGLILVVLGCIYNGFFKLHLDSFRIPSVLGLIGMSYIWGSLVVMRLKPVGQLIAAIGILVGYYVLMVFVPVPGYGAGVLTPEGNWASYIDRMIMSGHMLSEYTDPEGLIMTLPASVLVVMGSFAGMIVQSQKLSSYKKVGSFVLTGLILLGISLVWSKFFPYNKKLWTSSFILLAGGLCYLFFALFYLVVDVWKIRKVFFPFVLIGMNPITIYFAADGLIDFGYTANFFLGGIIGRCGAEAGLIVHYCGIIVVELLFLYFLYRKKIFVRV